MQIAECKIPATRPRMANTELTVLKQVCVGSMQGKRSVNTLITGMKSGPHISPEKRKTTNNCFEQEHRHLLKHRRKQTRAKTQDTQSPDLIKTVMRKHVENECHIQKQRRNQNQSKIRDHNTV
jgi:hypothetical protein